ncbi:uncharacterized protein LOC131677941 [Topomyia yanbarensis]|uniref:uncharacterized protein LOC131677941 n=1 Tax=Topomyia yanbarensis TaxID=2498891 RepID=UPI00273C4FDE|nr:uncharacterized protein LOC131677941 [Topomyia yanbarensis]
MLKVFIVVLTVLSLESNASPLESDYRKYLRTRRPQAPGEVHVEEVLEVFKTKNRPPTYGVYNAQVNGFLANDLFVRRKAGSTITSTTPKSMLTTPTNVISSTVPLWRNPRTTYPTPSGDNENPDYTYPFNPTISMTKYPNYVRPTTIIIQEAAEWTTEKLSKTSGEGNGADYLDEDHDEYRYSNEDYFE